MSANIPPLLEFFRTSALVSVLIYEKEHTQKQQSGNSTIAKKYWHEKNEDYTQHALSESEKQLQYLNETTHPPLSDYISRTGHYQYINDLSKHQDFLPCFPVVCFMPIWWNRHASILINTAAYTGHIMACVSLVLYMCNVTWGVFLCFKSIFFHLHA